VGVAVIENSLRREVVALLEMDQRQYELELNALIRRHWSRLRDVADYLCLYQGCERRRFAEDFTSIAAAELARMIDSWRQDPQALDQVGKIERVLIGRCRNATRQVLRECQAPASGMSSRLLVHSMLTSLSAEMARRDGREPRPQEVVDEHNRRMRASRKDPVRSGMIATLQDYHLGTTAMRLELPDEDEAEGWFSDPEIAESISVDPESESTLVADQMSGQTIAACYEVSEAVGMAAEVGLQVLVAGGPTEAARAVAEALGCSVARARQLLEMVRQVGREVAVGAWGITGD